MSRSLHDTIEAVPTWNCIVVHASGVARTPDAWRL
ncbi:hypothetical protein CMK11_11670 [Candidatus Poribacteria bacterium]|nr:hypothetical protein [Candidatus Poribacteria bacterium]